MSRWWPWGKREVDPAAQEAVELARQNLEETKNRWPAVDRVAAKAEHQMRTNHFAPTIAKALGEHR